jgi:hypothetical protein
LREEVLAQALAAALGIRDESWRAEVLAGLALHLSGAPQEVALQGSLTAVRSAFQKWWPARALKQLMPQLTDPMKQELLQDALASALEIDEGSWRAEALAGLLPFLSYSQREQALRQSLAAIRQTRESWKAEVLVMLSPHLTKPLLHEAMAIVREIVGDEAKTTALTSIVLHLPASLLSDALGYVLNFRDAEGRTEACAHLSRRSVQVPDSDWTTFWSRYLRSLAAQSRQEALASLGTLSPLIANLGSVAAIAETFRAIQDVGRWWP